MAKLYGNIASSALMTFDKSFARANGQPLDSTEVYYSLDSAKEYAAGAGAYVGQKIVVIEDNVVTHYSIEDTAGNLKELGCKPVGDGQSVSVAEDGTVSIFGFDTLTSAEVGYIPQIKEVIIPADPENDIEQSRHLEIEWVAISAVVEGDGNSVTTVSARDKSMTVTDTAAEDFEGHKYEVNVNVSTETQNALELKADGLYVAETDLSNYYDKEYVDGIEDRVETIETTYLKAEDAYNDTALSGRVSTIEGIVGKAAEGENEATGLVKAVADNAAAITAAEASAKTYTDAQIDGLTVIIENVGDTEYIVLRNNAGEKIASADASTFVKDSFLNDVSYDATTGKVSFVWTMGDGSTKTDEIDIAHLVDTYTAGNGIAIENNVVSIDTAVVATVEELNKVKATAEDAQTAGEVASAITQAITNANLNQYAKADQVAEDLGKKLDVDTYNTDKATFAIESEVNTALANKVDNTTLNDYYTSAQIDEKGFAVASTVDETYATKQALAGVKTTADAAATQTYVDTQLTKKADKTDLNDYYTKEESYAKSEVYTKGETDNKIDAKIASVTGGESAADVKSALESYRDVINAELWGAGAGSWTTTVEEDGKTKVVYTPQYGDTSRIDTLEGEVTNIKTKNEAQDKSISDNAAAIKTQGDDITTIQNRLNSEDTGITVLNNRLAALETEVGVVTESRIDGLEGSLGTLSTTVGEHTTAITSLGQEDARLVGLITGNTDKFADYSTTTQMNAAIETAITDAKLNTYAKKSDLQAIYKAGEGDGEDAIPASGILAAQIERAKTAEKENADAIAALIDKDSGKTIRTIANEEAKAEVATLVGEAPETLDTIHEIASWITNDTTGAAAMSTKIAEHSDILAGIGGDEDQHDTVLEAINAAKQAAIDAIPALAIATADTLGGVKSSTAENGVVVGTYGTMEVNSVNINKLVQTAGDTLILNGGSAEVPAVE